MPDRRLDLDFTITPQPDDETCGPSCLHSVYGYFDDAAPLEQLVRQVEPAPGGGTLAVHLAMHALRRGYDATIYTCNLQLFDPTWFEPGGRDIRQGLIAQMHAKPDAKLLSATRGYLEYLEAGGRLFMEDITPALIGRLLADGRPIIAGLSATWLYRSARERPADHQDDDAAGEPLGHFVVLHGLDAEAGRVAVADPYCNKPYPGSHYYTVDIHRVIAAILLGIVTYDAKLLVIHKPDGRR